MSAAVLLYGARYFFVLQPSHAVYIYQVVAPAGSSLLKSAIGCGAMVIDNTFCLTGQCEACMAEIDGEVVLSCMVPVPDDGRWVGGMGWGGK